MGTVLTTLLDIANGLLPGNGLWAIVAAGVLFLCLTLSGITGRILVWVETALLRA